MWEQQLQILVRLAHIFSASTVTYLFYCSLCNRDWSRTFKESFQKIVWQLFSEESPNKQNCYIDIGMIKFFLEGMFVWRLLTMERKNRKQFFSVRHVSPVSACRCIQREQTIYFSIFYATVETVFTLCSDSAVRVMQFYFSPLAYVVHFLLRIKLLSAVIKQAWRKRV